MEAEVAELRAREVPRADRVKNEGVAFLEWYNREFKRRFTLNQQTVKLVKALMAQGYEQKDMRMVSLYLKSRWESDVKMAEYLVPSTMLTAAKFGERLDLAREWYGDQP